MRRVLHVTDCYSTGVGRAVDTIVGLSPEHEHHLLWAGEDDPTGKGFASTHALPGSSLARLRAVRATVRATGADVVHAHSSRAGVYARAVPAGAPVVYQPHAYKLLDPRLPRAARTAVAAVERALGGRTDRVVVLSEQEARLAARLSPRAGRTVLPNVPSLASPGVRAPQPDGPRRRRVVMSGRVSPQKDPGWLAETAERLRERDPEVEVRWLGSADDPELTARLERAGVSVSGWLPADALVAELTAAGVYLHSAAYEGFPISVLDAAWCDAPVLAREIPAFAGTGLLTVADPAAAADRVLEVLAGGAVRERALRGARDLLREMNPQVQRQRLAEIYA